MLFYSFIIWWYTFMLKGFNYELLLNTNALSINSPFLLPLRENEY